MTPDKERILEQLNNSTTKNPKNNCWVFLGHKNPSGHGQIRVEFPNGEWKYESVHRISAYLFHNMPIDSIEHIWHRATCPNKNCWNPEHICRENQSPNMVSKTHCKLGHIYDGVMETTRDNLVRYCKECARIAQVKFRARKRKGKSA